MMNNLPIQRIGIIGSGRVAQALALGLAPHSIAPLLLWARSPEKRRAAVSRIGHGLASPDLDRLADDCDVIAIAVSDDAVAAVVTDLADRMPLGRAPFVFHVSGRSGAAILDPLRAAGARTAAIHPAMTFIGHPADEVGRMPDARFAITGSTPEAIVQAHAIVGLLNGVAVEIAEDKRSLYHAGLCHASNHLVTLIAGASRALANAGVDAPAALLAPLVRAALENSLDRGFTALSGPLLRGDGQTIGDHVTALGRDCPELLAAYRAMATATLDELERTGSFDDSSDLRRRLG